jgi:hypothetical protein
MPSFANMRNQYNLVGLLAAAVWWLAPGQMPGAVKIWPAPAGEPMSAAYEVKVDGQTVPVYVAKVAAGDVKKRWQAMDDKARSADYFETAAFGTFEMEGAVKVTVTCPEEIKSAKILPSSLRITPGMAGKSVTFALAKPSPVTVEINGNWVGSLHLFANPPEVDAPKPGAPGVVYFGPGIHEISSLVITNNQTVYLAGGAVVRAIIKPEEKFSISGYSGLKTYAPTLTLRGTNITLRGRGILDAGGCTTHARNLVVVRGRDINLEGVILRDASTWTIPVRQSDRVTIRNVKLIGYRANSDGIDICNSRNVLVEGCFIRTLDDLIVIKSDQGQGKVRDITARNCVLWNEVAHALSVGAELREDVENVLFEDCDVIHDKGREWTLRVYHCDSAWIRNVQFRNIRIEESPRLMSLWIDKAVWTRDPERGHIDGVVFENITAAANPLRVELKGFDEQHLIENVKFANVKVNGRPLANGDVKTNAFVRGVTVVP